MVLGGGELGGQLLGMDVASGVEGQAFLATWMQPDPTILLEGILKVSVAAPSC